MKNYSPLVALVIASLFSHALGESAFSQDTKETHTYKKVDKRELKIHVSKPADWKAGGSQPAVVFFHGGGWVGGTPGQFDEHCKHLTSKGMVCFQVEYRLLAKPNKKAKQKKGSAAAKPPAKTESSTEAKAADQTPTNCIHDAKSAMRWVRGNASKFGIDPNRIASGGGSAGGHLAAFLGTTDGTDDPNDDLNISARSNAMLLFNPVYNNGPDGWGTRRVGDRYQEFSPAHNITSDDAPSIVFLGTQDKLIPVSTGQEFQNTMRKNGVQSELRLYAGADHGFFNVNKEDGKWYRLTIEEMNEFLVGLGWIK